MTDAPVEIRNQDGSTGEGDRSPGLDDTAKETT
jgi:hypothetical protein